MRDTDRLERGRDAYGRREWRRAYDALAGADAAALLPPDDLERLGVAAYLIGRDDEFLRTFDRAHHAHLEARDVRRATRCAFWVGLCLLLRGESGPATGWLARARRLLEREGDCVERGYLLLPDAERLLRSDDAEAAHAAAADAAEIGERFADADLIAAARHVQGRAVLQQGQVEEGLALLDEAMVSVVAGELSPITTGLVYCSVIAACQRVYALARARQWTTALAQWCADQPQLVAFNSTCLVHRAEILQLQGAWLDAIEEAERACQRFSQGIDSKPPASALYRQAEVHRLRGEFAAAEEAYRGASQWGWEPQPGLALMRLAQGRADAAAAAIRRVVGATSDALERAELLPARVEISLALGEVAEARAACEELARIAEDFDTAVLRAMAAQARGAVELAEGDARAALGSLRLAWRVWEEVEAPYAAARVRVLLGLACRELGDGDGCRLEIDAARAAFEHLGAAPDLARIDALTDAPPTRAHGLTPRETEVLRLVAAGKTNKVIAAELFVSEKTIDRHVSNIFAKLGVPSRAAATAFAYKHKLV